MGKEHDLFDELDERGEFNTKFEHTFAGNKYEMSVNLVPINVGEVAVHILNQGNFVGLIAGRLQDGASKGIKFYEINSHDVTTTRPRLEGFPWARRAVVAHFVGEGIITEWLSKTRKNLSDEEIQRFEYLSYDHRLNIIIPQTYEDRYVVRKREI